MSNIENIEEARRDFAAVYIYYDDISYDYISQSPVYTFNYLMSNFGGTIGLW